MKMKFFYSTGLLLAIFIVSCGNSDQQSESEIGVEDELIKENVAVPKDSAVIAAYKNDKSNISINDIDMNDTTISTRTKVLYHSINDAQKMLAVVYGLKKDFSAGIAVIQKGVDKPVRLKGVGEPTPAESIYSDEKITLKRSGNSVFLTENGVQEQFEEIK